MEDLGDGLTLILDYTRTDKLDRDYCSDLAVCNPHASQIVQS